MQAALFTQHPYGKPIIGWGHEIEGLDRDDALAYYDRFYTPENAILVVAGDVEPAEVIALARKDLRADPGPRRSAEAQPPARAGAARAPARHALGRKGRAAVAIKASISRPPIARRAPGEAEALEVLGHLLGGGQTPASSSRDW